MLSVGGRATYLNRGSLSYKSQATFISCVVRQKVLSSPRKDRKAMELIGTGLTWEPLWPGGWGFRRG
jgi:hypothetical protein